MPTPTPCRQGSDLFQNSPIGLGAYGFLSTFKAGNVSHIRHEPKKSAIHINSLMGDHWHPS